MVKGKPITVRSSEYLGVVSVYLPEIILKAEMSKKNVGEGAWAHSESRQTVGV